MVFGLWPAALHHTTATARTHARQYADGIVHISASGSESPVGFAGAARLLPAERQLPEADAATEPRELPKTLTHDSRYPDPGRLVGFLGLHDMPRFLHRQGTTAEGLKQAFTFLPTARGIPMTIGMGWLTRPVAVRTLPLLPDCPAIPDSANTTQPTAQRQRA